MPIFGLSEEFVFPSPTLADENGVLAVGGDFQPERLVLAYHNGIFPWPHEDMPLLWFSPPQRFVLRPLDIHLSRSLKKAMKQSSFSVTFDAAFVEVMKGCQKKQRPGQEGTWITDEMIEGYQELHELGFAHSVEVTNGGSLVGGLYGVSLGATFFGESMFSLQPEASKVGFATLVAHMIRWGFQIIDCQQETKYLGSFGAKLISREEFLRSLADGHTRPTLRGKWECTMTPSQALAEITSRLADARKLG